MPSAFCGFLTLCMDSEYTISSGPSGARADDEKPTMESSSESHSDGVVLALQSRQDQYSQTCQFVEPMPYFLALVLSAVVASVSSVLVNWLLVRLFETFILPPTKAQAEEEKRRQQEREEERAKQVGGCR
jgi:hypothetical protein